ncbi:MAG: hypothetical protein ABFR89_02560 [Actinomycetota bacterium]
MNYNEVSDRVDTLRQLHVDSDRERIRAVMDGGAEGIMAVLTWGADDPAAEAAKLGLDLPTANIMWSGLERLAQRIGRMPTLKTDTIPVRDTSKAREAADKRHRVVTGWDEIDRFEMQFPQMGRWLPGYSFTMQRIKERKFGDTMYPVAELRDPYDVYPGWWGPGQQPDDAAVIRRIPAAALRRIYPHAKQPSRERRHGGVILGRGGWEGSGGNLEVIEYLNTEGSFIICTETKQILDFIPNPLESGPAFVFTKRFAFNKLKSQYTHLFGVMAMMAKLNLLGLIGAEDSTFRETNVFGDLIEGKYEKGRDAINFLEPGTRVEKVSADQVNQTWQAIQILERQFRVVANYDVQQDGSSPNSWATGAGMKELQGAADNNVREYQLAIKHSVEMIDRKRLEWEDAMHRTKKKKVYWYEGSKQMEEKYSAEVDIDGDYRTKRVYGAMATFDETQKLLAGMQLLGAGVIDVRTLRENLDGLDNLNLISERIDQDTAKQQMLQGLGQRFASQDPAAALALAEILDNPSNTAETLLKLFTPQEPQMSPEEEAMAQMGGMGGAPPPGGGMGGGPESVQTILSLMEGQGGGVQTVAQV